MVGEGPSRARVGESGWNAGRGKTRAAQRKADWSATEQGRARFLKRMESDVSNKLTINGAVQILDIIVQSMK